MKISEILYENHITEDDLEEGVNDPHIFKIIFMAGGPGSGKSFVSNKLGMLLVSTLLSVWFILKNNALEGFGFITVI